MQKVVEGVYTFTGLMVGRVYAIVEPDGITLIDASIPPAANKILSQLEKAGHQPRDVKRILITHAHPDHVGALPKLAEATGAEVIASSIERPVVEGKIPIPQADRSKLTFSQKLLKTPNTTNKPTTVHREVTDGSMIDGVLGGLEVVFTPGHAPGHVAYYSPSRKIAFIGDVIMPRFGKMALPLAAFTVDMEQNRRSVRRVAELDLETVCFGHGVPIISGGSTAVRQFAMQIGVL